IEGVMMPGKGRMTVTGNLRDVMKESISAAASAFPTASTTARLPCPTLMPRSSGSTSPSLD
ncbi:MAG: hypothetical protein E5V57_34000, partial [Mesorhizobium sp.]